MQGVLFINFLYFVFDIIPWENRFCLDKIRIKTTRTSNDTAPFVTIRSLVLKSYFFAQIDDFVRISKSL